MCRSYKVTDLQNFVTSALIIRKGCQNYFNNSYSKTNQMHQCIKFILFGVTLYMFRTVFLSIISSSSLYIQQPNLRVYSFKYSRSCTLSHCLTLRFVAPNARLHPRSQLAVRKVLRPGKSVKFSCGFRPS